MNLLLSVSVSFWVFSVRLAPSVKTSKINFDFLFQGPVFIRGCKGTHYFLISKSFFKNFSIFIFLRQSVKELHFLYSCPFFERGCKGRHYFLISKSFFKIFQLFSSRLSLFHELSAFTAALFSNGIAKVRLFSVLPNFSATILKLKTPETALDTV